MAGAHENSMFNLYSNCHIVFQSDCTILNAFFKTIALAPYFGHSECHNYYIECSFRNWEGGSQNSHLQTSFPHYEQLQL